MHPLQQLRHRRRLPAHPRPAQGGGRLGGGRGTQHSGVPCPRHCPQHRAWLLQDPPAFTVRPKEEYFQEVGRELVVPCAAHGDPPPTITWGKVRSTLGVLGHHRVGSPRVLVLAGSPGVPQEGSFARVTFVFLGNEDKILPLCVQIGPGGVDQGPARVWGLWGRCRGAGDRDRGLGWGWGQGIGMGISA